MYTSLPDQPLGSLDLIGFAFRFWRRNMAAIVRYLFVPSVFTSLAGVLFQWAMTDAETVVNQTKNIGAAAGLAGLCFAGFMVWTIVWWWLSLRLLALVRVSLGFSASLDDAHRYVHSRKMGLAGLFLLTCAGSFAVSFIWIIVALMGAVVPGPIKAVTAAITAMIGVVGLLVTFVAYVLISNFSFVMIACENNGVFQTISNATALSFRYFLRSTGFWLIFAVVFFAVSTPLSMPIGALTVFDYIRQHIAHGSPANFVYHQPVYLIVLANTWDSFIGLLLRPLFLLSFGYFYYDLRMRSEAIDLNRSLQMIEHRASQVQP